MTEKRKTALFNRYVPMVHSIAYKLCPMPGQRQADLIEAGMAGLALLISQWGIDPAHTWDAEKASKTTWIYQSVRHAMLDHIRSMHRPVHRHVRPMLDCSLQTERGHGCTEAIAKPRSWLLSLLGELNEDACTVVNLVLIAPAELAEEISTAHRLRGRRSLLTYLRDKMGWPQARIDVAWAEIQEAL